MTSHPPARPFTLVMSAMVTALLGVVMAFGTIAALQLLTFVLPTRQTPVTIVGMGRHDRPATLGNRTLAEKDRQHRITIRDQHGFQRSLACPESLYQILRRRSSTHGTGATLHHSVLAHRPVAIALVNKNQNTSDTIRLTMPLSGILITTILCWGTCLWAIWRLHRGSRGFHWSVLLPGAVLAVVAGSLWWARGI